MQKKEYLTPAMQFYLLHLLRATLLGGALLLGNLCQAQLYPVQVNPFFIPPHNVTMSAYADATSEKFVVNLLLTDLNEVDRQVYLKLYIEGKSNGLSAQTLHPVAGSPPLYLTGGTNLRLTNLDLKQHFSPANLRGLTPQQYGRPLPDGWYDFCFEVYDYTSGQRLSQKRCATIHLLLNDPPFLNLPPQGARLIAEQPQNILFNWTPRHVNPIGGTHYELTIKEIWDQGLDPQAGFLNRPVFYQTTTNAATLLYGPDKIPLLPGRTYAWRVRAIATSGLSQTSLFNNDGYSPIHHFTFQADCGPITDIAALPRGTEILEISWATTTHVNYQVQYRQEGATGPWYSRESTTSPLQIDNLKQGTTYQFQVGGQCLPEGDYRYSPPDTATTLTPDQAAFQGCGTPFEPVVIHSEDPLESLRANETFTAADFIVTVHTVSGGGGRFSGTGAVTLEPFGGIKMRVHFDDISINKERQLFEGFVELDSDPLGGNIADLNKIGEKLFGGSGKVHTYDAGAEELETVEATLQDNGKVTVVLVGKSGTRTPIETDVPVVITDAGGQQWLVDEKGEVTHLGQAAPGGPPKASTTAGIGPGGKVTHIASPDVRVTFMPSGYYATDQWSDAITSNGFSNHYQTLSLPDGGSYRVLYKALSDIADHTSDELEAEVALSGTKTLDSVVFKTKEGTAVPTEQLGKNKVKLTLTRRFEFGKQEILATVPASGNTPEQVAGKVDIWHMAAKSVNVTLVPLNGASPLSNGQLKKLTAIYQKVGIELLITQDDNFDIDPSVWDIADPQGKLNIGDSRALASYTVEERALYRHYAAKKDASPDRYYVFLANKLTTTDAAIKGFMPLKRQYGFIFSTTKLPRLIAHELGHGIFGLQHPYDQYAGQREGTTDLLMDTGRGERLSLPDWQTIHAPGLQFYAFQKDEQGESAANQLTIIYDGETYETGATIVTVNNTLDQEKVEIKDNLNNVIPFEEVKWDGVTVDAENKTVDFSKIVDKGQTFKIEANGLKSNYRVKKIKAKFSRAPEPGKNTTRINAYGYDKMNKSAVTLHHINVGLGEKTWLRVGQANNVNRIKFIVEPAIATVISDCDTARGGKVKIYAKILADKEQTGDAVVKVVVKKTGAVLSSINLHIYEEVELEGEVYAVYDPSYQEGETSPLSIEDIKDKANSILRHAVASTKLTQITPAPVNFDMNGNKQLDYFINMGGTSDRNHELYEVYKEAGGLDANNILLLQEEPVKRFYFMEDFIAAKNNPKQIVLGPSPVLKRGFKVGTSYVISAPDGKKKETFTVREIKEETDNNHGTKYVLVINKKLKHDHRATTDMQEGHLISYSETPAQQKLAGLQSIRGTKSKKNRAMISVILKANNDFIGTIVAHEQLHGGGLSHVTDKSNIMHFSAAGTFDASTGAITENQSLSQRMPVRYKHLDKCNKIRTSQGKDECNANGSTENQWETLKRPKQ